MIQYWILSYDGVILSLLCHCHISHIFISHWWGSHQWKWYKWYAMRVWYHLYRHRWNFSNYQHFLKTTNEKRIVELLKNLYKKIRKIVKILVFYPGNDPIPAFCAGFWYLGLRQLTPKEWNVLPESLRCAESALKTYYFK